MSASTDLAVSPLASVPGGWGSKPPVVRLRFSSIGAIIAGGILLYGDLTTPSADAGAGQPSFLAIAIMIAGLVVLVLSSPRPLSRRAPRLTKLTDFTDSSLPISDSFVHLCPNRSGLRPSRHGVSFGKHGIALRLEDVSREIDWDDIVAIKAGFLESAKGRHTPRPGIRIVAAAPNASNSTHTLSFGIPIDTLDVAPRMLYTALLYFWRTRDARAELGTATAQRRLEAWTVASRT